MFKKLLLEQIISFENSFNGFIYYLRQLPFFEKRISYGVFQHNKFKHVLSIVTFIFGILMKFAGRLVYAAAFLMIPYIILRQFVMGNTFQYEETVINVFFMMNCVCGSLVNTVILSSSDEDYMMLNVLRINPKEHYVGELLFKLITDFGLFFVVLWIFDIGAFNSLLLVTLMTAFRCIGEASSLLIYSRIPFLYKRITRLDVIIILVCVYFAYVNPYMRGRMVSVDSFVFSPLLLGVICSIGLICFIILCTYRYYPRLARKRVRHMDVEYEEEIQARTRIREVEAKQNVTGAAALMTNRHEKKKGFSYLNHIFFDRNKKLLLKSPNKRMVWILLISFAVILYTLSAGEEIHEKVWKIMTGMDTVWCLVMYLCSCSKQMCRVMFYNCDKDMMNYSYYTKKRALISNFVVRMRHFILIDLRVAGIISFSMCILAVVTGHSGEITAVLPVILNAVLFSVLFSIYHVGMYHIMQPYDELMKVKIPLFNVTNILVGVLGVIFWQLPMNAIGVLVVQIMGIAALLVFCFVLVKEFGPDNFHIK